MYILLFFVVLAVLILVHEFGHFIVAKKSGIRVDEFGLGFGPKIFGFKKGEVEYTLNIIPFGGFVKIFGENPDDTSISGPDSKRSFVNKPRHIQAAVLAAGVFFNFIFAWILFSIAFMIGSPASVESYPQYADRMTSPQVIVASVSPDSPAAKAGLKGGDIILSINTATTSATIDQVQQVIRASEGKSVTLSYKRGELATTTSVVPEKKIGEENYAIGVAMDNASVLQLPFFVAIWEGGKLTLHMIAATAVGFWDLISGMFQGKADLSAISGPVGIAGYVGDAAHLGFSYLLMFTALISINLGVINLVPFPALDGGRLLFVGIEAIARRRIKPTFVNWVNGIGFALLLLLLVVVTYRDIAKIFFK